MKSVAIKKNELLLYAMTWMNFLDIISGKKTPFSKNTNFRVPFMKFKRCMTYLYQIAGYLGKGVSWDGIQESLLQFWKVL